MNCIIIEDEPLAMERTAAYVQKTSFLDLSAAFSNGAAALAFLRLHQADLVFLDIHLGELSGIRLLEAGAISGQVILTTAYPEYALKGFDLKVTDYLLKPFTYQRFLQAAERAQSHLVNTTTAEEETFIFIKTEHRLEKIFLHEILYIEGMRDYRKIHTIRKKIMTLKTFTDLEKEIPPKLICRIHKSYMVALAKIDAIEKDRVKINNICIPVSETYKKEFFALVNASGKAYPG